MTRRPNDARSDVLDDEPWRTVASSDGYPATTAADSQRLRRGQAFSQRLEQSEQAVAVRIPGTPACGDAMYLAGLIADDLKMTKTDLRHWVRRRIAAC